MGELIDYYVILGVVLYDNDPLHNGRIKCVIPGVIHSDTTEEEAMPWIRCFKMGAFQTFSRPIKGQKVWILISKTNYNEYWWFPYFETIDITQAFLDEHYDDNPDVFHSRHSSNGDVMSTYDDQQGYFTKIGEDHINLKPNKEFELDTNNCRICIVEDKIYIGDKNKDPKEPTIMGEQFNAWRDKMKELFQKLEQVAKSSPYTTHLSPPLLEIIKNFRDYNAKDGKDLTTKYTYVN